MLVARRIAVSLGFAMMLSPVAAVQAQDAQAPAAPLPAQIASAKKAFISNTGVGAATNYNEVYAAIKSWGRYEIVAAPEDADVVLEISLTTKIAAVSGSKDSGCDSSNASTFKLVVLDAKTHFVLWTIAENVQPFARAKTGEKNMGEAMNRIVSDLKLLTTQPAPVDASK